MQYAILCYHSEETVGAWSAEQEARTMADLGAVRADLVAAGKLGPVARLQPTRSARTLRKDAPTPYVVDGPFAETKEQLLGFYIVDCVSMDEALDAARDLARANPGGAFEVRPLMLYHPDER